MTADFGWDRRIELDVQFGYLANGVVAPRQHHPQLILNGASQSVLRVLREELRRCHRFVFSVAFVSPRAIALLKQELVEFEGEGHIVTSDYLGFNSPSAFAELLNLTSLNIDVRIHSSTAFHPKGYIFEGPETVTAMVGSSNLTENALVRNHEWNLKVAATPASDLAEQFSRLVADQLTDSTPLSQAWIDQYAATYVTPSRRARTVAEPLPAETPAVSALIDPNDMQREALLQIEKVRDNGARRAIIISATGTGKTILSALDVRAANPDRLLFVVHREQILDRTIHEYQRVLGGLTSEYGKLSGSSKDTDARYLFATVQTLSQRHMLQQFDPEAFDYIIIDEAHRAGAKSHRAVIDYFRPDFLLGMTATPERTDGFNVFELFHFNTPYEIRLNHALEEDMLCPFHYYGVADVTLDDGTTTSDEADLKVLISVQRVDHLLRALETYAQAGVPPRGLIFCSRTEEARHLSNALNDRALRGLTLRTVALASSDPVPYRESQVELLERGELDYILTVNVFNEGIDVPTVNQVVMLRNTKSSIVFVQQLGRGLRKAVGKDYLVVLDFIGNYSNNFLIPIALFGDESLNKESLRKNLISAEEAGVLPGLSSVRFDRVSQERVLSSIVETSLDSMQRLKSAILQMRNRVGGVPKLWDFLRFESVDPVLLATKREHFPALIKSVLREDPQLSDSESRALQLLSHEVLPSKRAHEAVFLDLALRRESMTKHDIEQAFEAAGLPGSRKLVESTVDTFTLDGFAEADLTRYGEPLAERLPDDQVRLSSTFRTSYATSPAFAAAVDDIVLTSGELVDREYREGDPFAPGRQYSRKEVARLLCWPRKWQSTLYGYKTAMGDCPIFVTLHKADDVGASTRYDDQLIDVSSMLWSTRSRRTLKSAEIQPIINKDAALYVFVKKDDAEGTDFYFLGRATAHEPFETSMPGDTGEPLSVVHMTLRFEVPIPAALFDYFHPTVTADTAGPESRIEDAMVEPPGGDSTTVATSPWSRP